MGRLRGPYIGIGNMHHQIDAGADDADVARL